MGTLIGGVESLDGGVKSLEGGVGALGGGGVVAPVGRWGSLGH